MTEPENKPANVVVPQVFGQRMSEEERGKLIEAGAETVGTVSEFDALEDVKEPGYGEQIIGHLDDRETGVYIELHQVHIRRDELQREIGGDVLIDIGRGIKEGDERLNKQDIPISEHVDEAKAKEFFRLVRREEMLRAALFWSVSERFACHDWVIGVRTKRRIVKTTRKW